MRIDTLVWMLCGVAVLFFLFGIILGGGIVKAFQPEFDRFVLAEFSTRCLLNTNIPKPACRTMFDELKEIIVDGHKVQGD